MVAFLAVLPLAAPAAAALPGKNGKIAFSAFRNGNMDIFTVNFDGSGQTRLTTAAAYCKAERDHFGEAAFRERYGGGADAYGRCVSRN